MNFNQVNKQEAAALLRLKSPEMHPLLMFFNKQLEDTMNSLVTANAENFHRLQGRASYLRDLLVAVESASSVVEKLS